MAAPSEFRNVSPRGIRIAVLAAETGTVLLAVAAFLLSFNALHDLARRSGVNPGLAWLWPVIVDGIVVVATISVFALAGARAVWYPWLLLILGAAMSVAANAIHSVVAAEPGVPPLLAASVAAVPPIVLVASTHLTVVLIRYSRTIYVAAASSRTAPASPVAKAPPSDLGGGAVTEAPDAGVVDTDPTADAASLGTSSAQRVPVLKVEPDSRRELGEQLWAEGLRKAEIARLLGVNRSTVTRWNLPEPVEGKDLT